VDLEVLALAAKEGRILVTHDWKSMPVHFIWADPGVVDQRLANLC
jgi:predicted nuclease of predicted toxin-antitoxin system